MTRLARSPGLYLITEGAVGVYHKSHSSLELARLQSGGMFGDCWLLGELEHFDFV